MTKRQLIEALSRFDDDQWVVVKLHSDDFPHGCQSILQGVEAFPTWHEGPDIIGLVAHAINRELPIWRQQAGKDEPPGLLDGLTKEDIAQIFVHGNFPSKAGNQAV